MGEIVVAPDAEAVCVKILTAALGEVPVSTDVPKARPPRFVTISLAGGDRPNRVTWSPIVTVRAWDENEPGAFDLAALAEAVLLAAEGNIVAAVWVRTVTTAGGLAFLPDPDTTIPRYQFSVELNLRPHLLPDSGLIELDR